MNISNAAMEWLKNAEPHETGTVDTANYMTEASTVDGCKTIDIGLAGGAHFVIDTPLDRQEFVGKQAKLYGKGFGYPIQAVVIGEHTVYAYSNEEMEQRHQQMVEDHERKDKENFEKNKAKMDEDYEALPPEFKKRIDRFRANNPNFRWQFEPYELFCCHEALRMVEHFKTPEALSAWVQNGYTEVEETDNPFKPDEGHSGNTIGCSAMLASMYMRAAEIVPYIHGAMAMLVGCKAYGCHGFEEGPEIERLSKKYPKV